MRIDTAGHYVLSSGVDDSRAFGRVKILTDRGNQAVRAQDIGARGAVRIYDSAAFDQNSHR
jgi:hypothetical protein